MSDFKFVLGRTKRGREIAIIRQDVWRMFVTFNFIFSFKFVKKGVIRKFQKFYWARMKRVFFWITKNGLLIFKLKHELSYQIDMAYDLKQCFFLLFVPLKCANIPLVDLQVSIKVFKFNTLFWNLSEHPRSIFPYGVDFVDRRIRIYFGLLIFLITWNFWVAVVVWKKKGVASDLDHFKKSKIWSKFSNMWVQFLDALDLFILE